MQHQIAIYFQQEVVYYSYKEAKQISFQILKKNDILILFLLHFYWHIHNPDSAIAKIW